jgi:hypothetical protein
MAVTEAEYPEEDASMKELFNPIAFAATYWPPEEKTRAPNQVETLMVPCQD